MCAPPPVKIKEAKAKSCWGFLEVIIIAAGLIGMAAITFLLFDIDTAAFQRGVGMAVEIMGRE